MVEMEFITKGRKSRKQFKTYTQMLKFFELTGYTYDDIGKYYWKVNTMLGWVTKVRRVH